MPGWKKATGRDSLSPVGRVLEREPVLDSAFPRGNESRARINFSGAGSIDESMVSLMCALLYSGLRRLSPALLVRRILETQKRMFGRFL